MATDKHDRYSQSKKDTIYEAKNSHRRGGEKVRGGIR